MVVGTQTTIVGAPEHLKCKLLSGTFKDAANYAEPLREYLARFSEATIKVSNPNQEMFVAAFHNGLKEGHFNEFLAQKPASSMQEVIKKRSVISKGNKVTQRSERERDVREKDYASRRNKAPDSQQQRHWPQQEPQWQGHHRKPYHQQQGHGDRTYPHARRFTPLNNAKVHVLHEILATGLAVLPPARDKNARMGLNDNAWCAYHRCKGHDTENCFRLRDLIDELIKSGYLRKFLEDAAQGRVVVPKPHKHQSKDQSDGEGGAGKSRIAVNTIAGGFSGGGETSS
ncbi:hypothetical protein A2U01_0018759, partial [Trifolium medium]|nr:hypothetical protein [Trifolium medium]